MTKISGHDVLAATSTSSLFRSLLTSFERNLEQQILKKPQTSLQSLMLGKRTLTAK